MHRNWETLDVDKIQERWCVVLVALMMPLSPLIITAGMKY